MSAWVRQMGLVVLSLLGLSRFEVRERLRLWSMLRAGGGIEERMLVEGVFWLIASRISAA